MSAAASLSALRSRLGYHAVLLGIVVLISSAALVIANSRTKDEIAKRMEEDLQTSLQQVVPATLYDNAILKDTVLIRNHDTSGQAVTTVFYRARKQGKIVALAFPVTTYGGYSGAISMIIGIDIHGTLLGVRILSHAETPGLGDKIETGKSKWILGFNGLSLGNPPESKWKVKKDGGQFDSFTGATITPRAVVAGIRNALKTYSQHREEILKPPLDKSSSGKNSGVNQAGSNHHVK